VRHSVTPDEAAAADPMSLDVATALETAAVEESLFVWMAIHGNLCLALRHPENQGLSRSYTVAFVEKIGRLLVDRGLLTQEQLDHAQQVETEQINRMRS
jgi:hypothetical protein